MRGTVIDEFDAKAERIINSLFLSYAALRNSFGVIKDSRDGRLASLFPEPAKNPVAKHCRKVGVVAGDDGVLF
jgi:hypothetical protein